MATHPNRSKAGKARNPSPAEVRALRESAGLTQQEFGEMLHTSGRVVMQWEQEHGHMNHRRMHPAFWELVQRKLGVWKG